MKGVLKWIDVNALMDLKVRYRHYNWKSFFIHVVICRWIEMKRSTHSLSLNDFILLFFCRCLLKDGWIHVGTILQNNQKTTFSNLILSAHTPKPHIWVQLSSCEIDRVHFTFLPFLLTLLKCTLNFSTTIKVTLVAIKLHL